MAIVMEEESLSKYFSHWGQRTMEEKQEAPGASVSHLCGVCDGQQSTGYFSGLR